MVEYFSVRMIGKGVVVNQKVPTKFELIAIAQSAYWEQCVNDPNNKTMVPLVRSVLDNNGMANDPAYWETISDICRALARYDHRQLILGFSQPPHHIQ